MACPKRTLLLLRIFELRRAPGVACMFPLAYSVVLP